MVKIADEQFFWDTIRTLPRPGEENILAFYEHRLGAIFTNPRLLLLPLDDHLVHRGDGVFETLQFMDGEIYQLEAHIARLFRSSKAISLTCPVSEREVAELARAVCQASAVSEGYILILLGRGPGGFSLDVRECPQASLYIVARRPPKLPADFWERGVSAMHTSVPAKQDWMSHIKTVNYLSNVLMKKEALEHGADFPLCFDPDGFLAEGATENAVIVDKDGVFVVPELRNALTGTTLLRAMDMMKPFRQVCTRRVTEDELYTCQELILLGTGIDAVGVVRYNDRPVGGGVPGPVARQLREMLLADRPKPRRA